MRMQSEMKQETPDGTIVLLCRSLFCDAAENDAMTGRIVYFLTVGVLYDNGYLVLYLAGRQSVGWNSSNYSTSEG